jgi:hypothetical protein
VAHLSTGAHARSGHPAAIAQYLGQDNGFADAITDFSRTRPDDVPRPDVPQDAVPVTLPHQHPVSRTEGLSLFVSVTWHGFVAATRVTSGKDRTDE